jgi:predicted outer membrane repeat protein
MKTRNGHTDTARVAALSVALVWAMHCSAAATVFTVDSIADLPDKDVADGMCLTDSGTCTLRAAVMQADVIAIDTTIILPTGTYVLSRPALGADEPDGGDLNLTAPLSGNPVMTITGSGAATTIIDANNIDRVLHVEAGRQAKISAISVIQGKITNDSGGGILNDGTLELSDSVLRDNTVVNGTGGGISNTFFLTVKSVTFDLNHATAGGGIGNFNVLQMQQGVFSGNTAAQQGGGIYDLGAGSISDSTFIGNHANIDGGAIYHDATHLLSLDLCRLSSNTASAYGGAISVEGSSTLDIDHSSFSVNSAGVRGGAIQIGVGAQIDMKNSTLSSNTSGGSGGAIANTSVLFITNSTIAGNSSNANGGGIRSYANASSHVNVYNSTIVYNQADADADATGTGAGVYNDVGSEFNIVNTVIAGNYLAGAPDYSDCDGQLGIYGSNRLGTGSGCTPAPGSPGFAGVLVSLNELGILQDNGGPTLTVALVPPSDMIDGNVVCRDKFSSPLPTDQRGAPRISGVTCDIGAFEYGSIVDALFASGFE